MDKFTGLQVGKKQARLPLIQGGMGIGISLGGLAGAVAKEGGVGIISAAQIGFREPDFDRNPYEANLRAVHKELEKAEKEANMFRNQLNNPKFVERAPEKLVNETRTKLAASEDKIANINQSIQALG